MSGHENISSLLNSLRNRILTAFPDINLVDSKLITTGWDNNILLVNDRIVFKFPMSELKAKSLEKEIRVVGSLSDSPIKVPDYIYVHGKGQDLFGGYNYIRGDPLNSVDTLSDLMINQFIHFMNYLNEVTDKITEDNILEFSDHNRWRDRYRKMFRNLRENYSDVIGTELFSDLESEFRLFLTKYSSSFRTSVTHGDLYRNNVVINVEKGRTQGVIDWGECTIGDPALDFAALSLDFPGEQIQAILTEYTGEVDEHFIHRIDFYRKIEPVYGIMHSLEKKDEDTLQSSIQLLDDRLHSDKFDF